VIITGYDANFNMEQNYDYLTIFTNSSSYRYTGRNSPQGMDSTTVPLIGLKSEKLMSISFLR
jgi:hypothetical protein